jgi:homoserine dehydrogenase
MRERTFAGCRSWFIHEVYMLKTVKVGICGFGTVGSASYGVLQRNADLIEARAGRSIEVSHIGARRDNPDCATGETRVSRDVFAVVDDPDIDIVVETIGGCDVARQLLLRAIDNGKHIVTANKALIAEHGNELFKRAADKGVTVAFEAAVAGGIPIIKAMREGLAANRIEWLAGIINGTGNFILTEMREKGRSFNDVLAEAQQLGYAEADPTFDIEGIDAAHKLVILAAIAFGMPLQFDKVFTEGISAIDLQDVGYAEELGYRIKHLGIARRAGGGIELRVHPTLIPEQRLLANVNGVKNAIVVDGDAVGPTLYYGAGAGGEPTASAVVADIIDIARNLENPSRSNVPYLAFHHGYLSEEPILAIEDVETAFYLRMEVQDRPGVLSKVAQIMSDAGISIEALIQKEPKPGAVTVPLILLTNRVREGLLMQAVSGIEALDSVTGRVVRMRVETLEG